MSPTRSWEAKFPVPPHYRSRSARNSTHGTNNMNLANGPFDRTRPHIRYAMVPIDATPEEAVAITGMPYGVTNAPPREVQQPRNNTKRNRSAVEFRSRTPKSPAKIARVMPVQPRQTRSKTQAAGASGSPRSSPHNDSGSCKSASKSGHGSRTRSLIAKLRLPSSVLKKLRGSGSHPCNSGEICNPSNNTPLPMAPPQNAFGGFGFTALSSNAPKTPRAAPYTHGKPLQVQSPIMTHRPVEKILRHDPRFFLSMQGQDTLTPDHQRLLLQRPWAFSQPPETPPYMREYLPGNQAIPMNYSPHYTTMDYQRGFSAPPTAGRIMESLTADISNGGAIPKSRPQSAPAKCYQYGDALPPVAPQVMTHSTTNVMNAQSPQVPNDLFMPLVQSELGNDGIFIRTGWCLNMVAIQDTRTVVNMRDGTVRIVVTGKANRLRGPGPAAGAEGTGWGME